MPSQFSKRVGFFDGIQGESLFYKPIFKMLQKNELPEMYKKVEGMHDARLLSLVTALIVEDRLDKILSAFLPKYRKLTEVDQFSFSMKIRLLEAMNFIPPGITKAAHCLRKTRNEFAHNLSITRLDELKSELQSEIKATSRFFYEGKEAVGTPEPKLEKAFWNVSFSCISGIDAYTVGVGFLRAEISNQTFIEGMQTKIREEDEKLIQEIMSKPPIETEEKGTMLVERFAQAVTRVTGRKSISDGN